MEELNEIIEELRAINPWIANSEQQVSDAIDRVIEKLEDLQE